MNILITGATGFIASHITTKLMQAGHQVTCCVRNMEYAKRIFPKAKVITCDYLRDVDATNWQPRLKGIDVVINCVGIFYHPNKKVVWNCHYATPVALFTACKQQKVKRIIHISALGIEKSAVEYAKSKKAAEDFLESFSIPNVVLKPSYVYGRGSYGGSSLFRGLAGLPMLLPVPGDGEQKLQPIHVEDLAQAVVNIVAAKKIETQQLHAVGPEKVPLRQILTQLRAWLGFKKTSVVPIPLWLIKIGALCGNLIPYSAMNMTAYKLLRQHNVTTPGAAQEFCTSIGFEPRSYSAGQFSVPSTVQDHWHARLFFLKPLLHLSISFVWIFTALCSLFFYPTVSSYALLDQVGIPHAWQPLALYGAAVLDAVLGLAFLMKFKIYWVATIQIVCMATYMLIISWALPQFWIDPFGPIVKNLPLIIATLTYLAIHREQ